MGYSEGQMSINFSKTRGRSDNLANLGLSFVLICTTPIPLPKLEHGIEVPKLHKHQYSHHQ